MDAIDYYNKYAAKIFEETVEEEVEEEFRDEFLSYLEEGDAILDLGCGSGRDSLDFYERGYDVTPLDGSEEMCRLAEVHTDLEVLCERYEDMDFDDAFEGVWARAAFIHVPKEEMRDILAKVKNALTNNGVFYTSVCEGEFEGISGELYFTDYEKEEIKDLLEECGFQILNVWEVRDEEIRRGYEGNGWIHVLARKK